MKARRLGLMLGGAAATAVVALVVTRAESPAAPVPAAPVALPSASTPTPTPAGEREGCRFTAGERYDVALTVQASVELGANAAAPLPRTPVLAESMSTTARLEVLESSSTHAVLLGALSDVKVTGATPVSAYQGPFLLEVDRDCEVSRYARHESTALVDARQQQAALWELSWRWTKGPETLTRHNGRGAWVARATTAREGTGVLAQRRVDAYRQLWLGGEPQSVVGFSSVQAGPRGWFDSLSTDETLTTSGGITRTRVRATVTAATGQLALDRDPAHYVWGDWLPKLIARREAPPVTAGDRELRAQMAGRTAADAVRATQDAFTKEQNLAKAWPPLRAFLEAAPEKTGEVIAELKGGRVTEDGLNPFFIALGNARTPEARDALLGLMRDTKAPPTVRARAMFGLVDRADVGVALANEFRSSSQALESNPTGGQRFVATESLLALSTMAGLHEDTEVRAVALDALSQHLTPGADVRSQGTALKALANLGDASLLPQALPFTASPDEGVRRAASRVLRRMAPVDTEPFAVDFLTRERSLLVKKDLLVTLEAQHFDAHARTGERLSRLLVQELQNEQHGVIARKALLRLVGNSPIAREPGVREVLKAQARRALARRDGLAADALELLTPEEVREVAP
ncbi:MAG: hypothetical protein ACOZQL_09405 [Myxococcota bacterium]